VGHRVNFGLVVAASESTLTGGPSRQAGTADLEVWTWFVLIVMGAMWGLSFSLARIATTSGAHPLGVAFWECSIAGMLLIGLIVYRRIALPITASLLRLHLTTGLVGMVIPGAAFFYAAAHVPAGVLSITIGMVPILTYIASTFLGLEKFAMGRIFGVILGAFAVVLLVAPESSLPDPGQLPWAFLGFVAAVCYAALGIVLALAAPRGANSLMLTCGMFVVGSLVMMPILYMTDSFVPFGWPLGVVEWSLLGLGAVNAVAYTLYFILVDRAGPVFTSFTANMVTLFGVLWRIVIFSERNSIWVWLSFATIMIAMAMVAPRAKATVAEADTDPR
jgi:drug/metabolite transporter (DMT)-like permease